MRQSTDQTLGTRRHWIIDIDHVVWQSGCLIDGVAEALELLRGAGRSVRFLTNDSVSGACVRAKRLRSAGLAIEDHEVLTASVLAGRYLQSAGFRRPLVLASPAAAAEVGPMAPSDAEDVDCIVVGDLFAHYDEGLARRACALLSRGLPLIAMQRNSWCGPKQLGVVDVGFWIAAFESVAAEPALTIGKPSPFAFVSAIESIPGATPQDALMVGDDLEIDLAQASGLGMATIHISSNGGAWPRWLDCRFPSLVAAVEMLTR